VHIGGLLFKSHHNHKVCIVLMRSYVSAILLFLTITNSQASLQEDTGHSSIKSLGHTPQLPEESKNNIPLQQWLDELDTTSGDDFPSVAQQLEEYRRIYTPYSKMGHFDPEKTPIPELACKINLLMRYILPEVRHDKRKVSLLHRFWSESQRALEENEFTFQRFRCLNHQVTFLLLDTNQRLSSYLYEVMWEGRAFQDLYATGKWQDISSYAEINWLAVQCPPTAFEAILYHPKGELPLELFLDAFLGDEQVVLSLAALAARLTKLGGPHGNSCNDQVMFLLHDHIHWQIFVSSMEHNYVGFWPLMQVLLRKVYVHIMQLSPGERQFGAVGLFLLLHEVSLKNGNDLHSPDKSEEAVTDIAEDCGISEQGLFATLIRTACVSMDAGQFDPVASFLRNYMKKSSRHVSNNTFELYARTYEKRGQDCYWVECDILLPTAEQSHQVGSVSYLVHVRSTDNPDFEECSTTAVSDYSSSYETVLPSVPELATLPPFDYQGLGTETVSSRLDHHKIRNADYIKLLNLAYGTNRLSSDTQGEQMVQALRQYFVEFYRRYKSVFSPQTLEIVPR